MEIRDERNIADKRGIPYKPDEVVAVPNDLMDKYMPLFKGKSFRAMMDLISQSYKAGLEIGRGEMKRYYEKELDKIYQ